MLLGSPSDFRTFNYSIPLLQGVFEDCRGFEILGQTLSKDLLVFVLEVLEFEGYQVVTRQFRGLRPILQVLRHV